MFKVGQKVVCVSNDFENANMPPLIIEEIYTISGFSTSPFTGNEHMSLYEIEGAWWYELKHFRPIDYNFGEVVAEHIEEKINQEQLQNV